MTFCGTGCSSTMQQTLYLHFPQDSGKPIVTSIGQVASRKSRVLQRENKQSWVLCIS